MLLNKFLYPLNEEPNDSGGKELSVNDMIDELSKDDLPIDDNDDSDLLEPVKEPVKEKEEELELEDDEEEKEEVDETQFTDVPRKEILKKYPEIFKDFPQLEQAYYREKKYAELLPTIEDARQAVDKATNYDKFEGALLNGDLDTVMGSVKTADSRAFNKMVDNYLPILSRVDNNAYFHVIGGVIKNTILSMVREGDRIQNDDLKGAAVLLNQFMFGTSEFKPNQSFGPNKVTNTEVQNERQQFVQEKFESVLDDLTTSSQNVIKSTIMNHIDPKNVMTAYVKRTAVKEALENVEDSIQNDARFKSALDKLWEKAFTDKFSKSSLDNIKKAYLNKAKTFLPSIIQKHRNDALRGLGKRVSEDREEPIRKGLIRQGPAATANNSGKKNEIPKGMKTLDYLMQD